VAWARLLERDYEGRSSGLESPGEGAGWAVIVLVA